MVLINGDPISLILTAAVVGIGAGIGGAIGTAIYKAFLEDRVQRFLDKKHRQEALAKLKNIDPSKSILFGDNTQTPLKSNTPINSESIVNKMLGK